MKIEAADHSELNQRHEKEVLTLVNDVLTCYANVSYTFSFVPTFLETRISLKPFRLTRVPVAQRQPTNNQQPTA